MVLGMADMIQQCLKMPLITEQYSSAQKVTFIFSPVSHLLIFASI
jgi:hypothetical protein